MSKPCVLDPLAVLRDAERELGLRGQGSWPARAENCELTAEAYHKAVILLVEAVEHAYHRPRLVNGAIAEYRCWVCKQTPHADHCPGGSFDFRGMVSRLPGPSAADPPEDEFQEHHVR